MSRDSGVAPAVDDIVQAHAKSVQPDGNGRHRDQGSWVEKVKIGFICPLGIIARLQQNFAGPVGDGGEDKRHAR